MPKYGIFASQHLADQFHLHVGGGRVARAVGEEHALRAGGDDVLEGGVVRQHVHANAALGEALRGHRLDAEVDRGDGELHLAGEAVVLRLDR